MKVITGGQTGVDMLALHAAFRHGLDTGGVVLAFAHLTPPIIRKYDLQILDSLRRIDAKRLVRRNIENLKQCDVLLACSPSLSRGGTTNTVRVARGGTWYGYTIHPKLVPVFTVDEYTETTLAEAKTWLAIHQPHILMVSGPREIPSTLQGVMKRFLRKLFAVYSPELSSDDDDDDGDE